MIIYVAEQKKSTEKNSVEKFRYTQRFGEGLTGKSNPALFLFDWASDKLVSLKYDSPVWFGQAVFGPDGDDKIFATGYETAPGDKLLGIKFCFNRPMGIWLIELNASESSTVDCHVRKLTPPHLSCRSPRIITSDGKTTLLWISESTGGAHASTAFIHSLNITSEIDPSQTRTLVDTIWEPAKGEFPGLYLAPILARNPRVSWGQGDHIVIQTGWRSRGTIVLISLYDGVLTELTPVDDENLLSWTDILAVDGNKLVCTRSSFTGPPELVLGEFDAAGSVSWKVIHKPVVSERRTSYSIVLRVYY